MAGLFELPRRRGVRESFLTLLGLLALEFHLPLLAVEVLLLGSGGRLALLLRGPIAQSLLLGGHFLLKIGLLLLLQALASRLILRLLLAQGLLLLLAGQIGAFVCVGERLRDENRAETHENGEQEGVFHGEIYITTTRFSVKNTGSSVGK